jgi:very-short-patch-repair endonuclease
MDALFTDIIQSQLDDSRRELLDLSSRNRLISIPIGSKSARLVQIFDEKADEVYKRLIVDKKTFTFLPAPGSIDSEIKNSTDGDQLFDDEEKLIDLPVSDEDVDPTTGKAKRHTDSRLQTRLTGEVLQRRLFDLHNEARTIIEEQGVNILYLALGYLKWVDKSNNNSARIAPLLLIPIDLLRQSIHDRFAIKWRDEDLQDNLSLAEKLKIEFGITLPLLNIDENYGLDLIGYFGRVEEAVKGLSGWTVERDSMCVGFFSFAKFLMYKDLDSASWPEANSPLHHSLTRLLLVPKSEDLNDEQPSTWTGRERLDNRISVLRLDHVVDADSSQTIAIEIVREGRNLVIQGPPGTGKSQTITNIIATAVLDGKKVLFLAEKLAALEVVKNRLEKEGLGVLCLELHSNKARKSTVAGELKATWELGYPSAEKLEGVNEVLEENRLRLNEHAERLHFTPQEGTSPFENISSLAFYGLPEGDEIDITFPGAERWTQKEIKHHESFLKELSTRTDNIGDIQSNPWRGVGLTHYTGLEKQRIKGNIDKLIETIDQKLELATRLTHTLQQDGDQLTLYKISRLRLIAELAGRRPIAKLTTIKEPIWEQAPTAIRSLSRAKQLYEQRLKELEGQVQSSCWHKDWTFESQQIELHGHKWYKILLGGYRKALSNIKNDLRTPPPKSNDEMQVLVKQVLEGQKAQKLLKEKQELGLKAFDNLWLEEGNGERLAATADWICQLIEAGINGGDRELMLGINSDQISIDAGKLTVFLKDYQNLWNWLQETLALSLSPYASGADIAEVPISFWREMLCTWSATLESLDDWVSWKNEIQNGKLSPIAPLVELIEAGRIPADHGIISLRRILAQQKLRDNFQKDPELTNFNGTIHNQKVVEFQKVDRRRLELAKVNVLQKHYQQLPPKRPVGAVGTVLGEVNKQRSHRPIRQLLSQAGPIVQDLKPVFMMSPLSVAQFLEPGKIEFDLLVIDEASQVKPVDALGAIARCRQLVVVGDDKQLPPSNFFSKLTSNDTDQESDDEEIDSTLVKAKEMESILSLAKARGLKDTLLRWHYRSKHHSLIAVSNQRFYENKLYVVPSPWKQSPVLGLVWRPVEGVYDRANTRGNAMEAKEVAKAVIKHAIHNHDQTLGVAAFSMAQQRVIQDEVERLRRQTPESEGFFAKYPHEPFFVKNLENVQGDERDVIFLSVGYGRDQYGKLSMNFGPLNRQGGERRLNVLISRARKRCEVFSSISDQDIELSSTTGEGVRGLKQFLHYTRTGQIEVAGQTGRGTDSPFEEAVKNGLESKFGFEVHTQVGVAGFFIDLAIVDPDRKGRYILGIECDGVAYHSSPSARERDRLRQSILESQGWIIHRLWGIDFFRKRDQELDKIKNAYLEALERLTDNDRIEATGPAIDEEFQLVRIQEDEVPFSIPYLVAPKQVIPHEDPYSLTSLQVGKMVHEILYVEAPIHFDELTTRMREQWGWSRAGDRFRTLVANGITILQKDQVIQQDGSFISLKDKEIKVRVRGESAPTGTRKPPLIPPAEIDLTLLHVTILARLLTREEAAKEVSLLLGFKSLSNEFKQIIDTRIDHLLRKNSLKEEGGNLCI